MRIFLDAGHGGKDSGAVGHGIQEKDIVLKIVQKMQALLQEYKNADVKLSRSTDDFISLNQRTQRANDWKADIFISVHCNSAASTAAKGFESYRYTNVDAGTVAFQNVLHDEIMKAIGSSINDRGKKQNNFHVLRDSAMKAVLTENLFINNAADAALLKQDSFIEKLAQGHVNGIVKFLGLQRIEKPPQKKPSTAKLYYVQVGAFEDKENADALAADLRKTGYRPFIKYE